MDDASQEPRNLEDCPIEVTPSRPATLDNEVIVSTSLSPNDGFQVSDEESAAWVVRKVLEARAHSEHVEQWASKEIQRARKEEQFFLVRYGPQLEAWLRSELQRRRLRCKSISLPSGTVGLRRLPPKIVIEDEPAAVQWARQHLALALKATVSARGTSAVDLVAWCRDSCPGSKAEEHLVKDDLGQYIQSTGEIPPGVDIRSGEERLYVG